jgi:mannose-1-phosphate guanylyltransferase / phosphomannomutase
VNAMILAAGLGTRLGTLGRRAPKVLLDIGGEPLLKRHLQQLEREGFSRVVINAHHLAGQILSFVAGYKGSLEISCLVEEQLLGTAGAVRNALPQLEPGPFLVVYGDVLLLDAPLRALFDFHRERGAVATLTVHAAETAEGKGAVRIDESGRVMSFEEKKHRQAGTALINSGVYVLEPELVASLPEGVAADFGHDLFPNALERGAPIFAYRLSTPIIDVGTPEGLELARAAVARFPTGDEGAADAI